MRGRATLLRGGAAADVGELVRSPSCRRTSGSSANDANVPPSFFLLLFFSLGLIAADLLSGLITPPCWLLSELSFGPRRLAEASRGAALCPPASVFWKRKKRKKAEKQPRCHRPPLCGSSSFRTPFFSSAPLRVSHFLACDVCSPPSSAARRIPVMSRLSTGVPHTSFSAAAPPLPHCQLCSAFQILLTVPIVIFHVLPLFTLCSL